MYPIFRDRRTREEKILLDKARPIAPQTKHPMKTLFHKTGRAWSFIANEIKSENYIIEHGGKVPDFLEEAKELSVHGKLGYMVKDIEGCYKGARPLMGGATDHRLTTQVPSGEPCDLHT